MQERLTRVLLLLTGVLLGALAQPLMVGQARGTEDPLIPAQPAVTSGNGAPQEAVEYNMYLPPPNPKVEKVVQKLDELGKNGWRLVGTTTANGGTSGFIFLRPRR